MCFSSSQGSRWGSEASRGLRSLPPSPTGVLPAKHVGLGQGWHRLFKSLHVSSLARRRPRICVPQFSSTESLSCPTLCDPVNRCTPGLPDHCQLPEFAQTHVHWVGDAIQPSHPLSSPSPHTFNLSYHQGHFQWVSSLHPVAKASQFQLQHESFQWILTTDFL